MKTLCAVYAQCPYYHREDPQKVYCEGVSDKNSIHLAFGSAADKREYEKIYCKGCWRKCLLAQMQNRRYGYED